MLDWVYISTRDNKKEMNFTSLDQPTITLTFPTNPHLVLNTWHYPFYTNNLYFSSDYSSWDFAPVPEERQPTGSINQSQPYCKDCTFHHAYGYCTTLRMTFPKEEEKNPFEEQNKKDNAFLDKVHRSHRESYSLKDYNIWQTQDDVWIYRMTCKDPTGYTHSWSYKFSTFEQALRFYLEDIGKEESTPPKWEEKYTYEVWNRWLLKRQEERRKEIKNTEIQRRVSSPRIWFWGFRSGYHMEETNEETRCYVITKCWRNRIALVGRNL